MSKLTIRGNGFYGLLIALLLGVIAAAPTPSMAKETWDHVANIKDAAKRLAILHLREGSPGVLKFLDACYRTQMLSSEYTEGLESCMAQDYMHSQVLAKIYAKIPQADRVRMGVPAPEDIANGMGQRFVAAFAQYKISVKEATAFKKMVDKNGMPIFVNAVFPPRKAGQQDDDGPTKQDAR
ncbi:MAG TPA: hypothetical protein VIF13_03670 [Hyphomicrobium sp.]